MNDPWNCLVEVLSGRHRPTPSVWAKRRVHRMCDDAPAVRSAARPSSLPLPPGRPEPHAALAAPGGPSPGA